MPTSSARRSTAAAGTEPLEYDTGSEPLWVLAGKLDAYAGNTDRRSVYAPVGVSLGGDLL